jgi:nicotinamidase/pyrazinamidase
VTIRSDRDALIIVDQQLDFEPGGALAVAGGDAIAPAINNLAARFAEVVITQDHHPRGHVSFASSYIDRPPYSVITLDEVERGEVKLSASAAFTLEELAAYLRETSGKTQALWPDHCVIGTPREAIDGAIDSSRATLILRKGYRPGVDSYSAFRENDRATTGLAEGLMAKGIERVFVAGLAGDYCVLYTALDAADAGFEVVYLSDLTRCVGVPAGSAESAMERLREEGVIIGESRVIAHESEASKG